MKYNLCENCGAGVANADDSVWEWETDEKKASISASIEVIGTGTVEDHDFGGYYDCFVCDEVGIGSGYLFTRWTEEDRPDYSNWVSVATDDDNTPIWSGPRDNAEEWMKGNQGQHFSRALAHRGVKLVIREWVNPS